MKSLTPDLTALLKSKAFKMADLYTITLVDNTVIRYTSFDWSLVVAGNTCTAAGLDRDKMSWKNDLSVDTMTITAHPAGLGTIKGMTFLQAVKSGVFDGATCTLTRAFMPPTQTLGSNLLTYPEETDNAAWIKTRSTVTANAIIAPDGFQTADKLKEDNSNNSHFASSYAPTGLPDSTIFCYSDHLKAGERTTATVSLLKKDATFPRVTVDLTTGQVTGTAGSPTAYGVVQLNNGWWRVWVAAGLGTGATSPRGRTFIQDNTSYQGDNASGIYRWGAQFEPGNAPTPYIKTTDTPFYQFGSMRIVGTVLLFVGRIGEITADSMTTSIPVNSHLELLNAQSPSHVYSSGCIRQLYDGSCGVNIATFTHTGTVTADQGAGPASRVLIPTSRTDAAGFYNLGIIRFTSGVNNGLERAISTWDGHTVTVYDPFPGIPAIGDTITLIAGCDKTMASCRDKFNNLANLRDFQFIPPAENAL